MALWSFLTNHGLVLTYIGRYPDSTGLEIAQAVRITERAVRRIVSDLLAEGYIEREKVGRRNNYRLKTHLPLRHPGERAATVGELLELLWRDVQPRVPAPPMAPVTREGGNHASETTGRRGQQQRVIRRTT